MSWKNRTDPSDNDVISACFFNGSIVHWNPMSGSSIQRYNIEGESFNEIQYSPDGNKFIIGTCEGHIDLYDYESGSNCQRLSSKGKHFNRVVGFKFLENNNNVGYSFGWDDWYYMWDTRTSNGLPIMEKRLACPNKTATVTKGMHIYSGILGYRENLTCLDIRKMSTVFKTTVKANQSQNILSPKDFNCGINTLNLVPHDSNKLLLTTVHNHTIKLISTLDGSEDDFMTQKIQGFKEIMSYESITKPVSGLFCDDFLPKAYIVGDKYNATLSYKSV